MNQEHSNETDETFKYKLWNEIKLENLPAEIDIDRLRQPKAISPDEPLLYSHLAPNLNLDLPNEIDTKNSYKNKRKINDEEEETKPILGQQSNDEKTNCKIQPSIDSYIINTIKLNYLLKNKISFDQIEFFTNRNYNTSNNNSNNHVNRIEIKTDQEARNILRQFISIMCIHAGFNEASSLSLDILVDVLDHFLESFFKLLKNLSSIYQSDLNVDEEQIKHNYYSTQPFLEQSLLESGVGTLQEIKDFYLNDIIGYYRQTFKKVSKMYEEYKQKKLDEKIKIKNSNDDKNESDLKLEEFMKENDFLNDESNSLLGELLSDFNASNFNEEMNKLLQMIGPDPFSIMNEDLSLNNNQNKNK